MDLTKNSSRRGFFGQATTASAATIAGAAILATPFTAKAADGEVVVVTTDIGTNHGHGFNLDMADIVKLLRELQPEEKTTTIDIQGSSGHAHDVSLSFDNLMTLLLQGVVVKESQGGNHTHEVFIGLEINS